MQCKVIKSNCCPPRDIGLNYMGGEVKLRISCESTGILKQSKSVLPNQADKNFSKEQKIFDQTLKKAKAINLNEIMKSYGKRL